MPSLQPVCFVTSHDSGTTTVCCCSCVRHCRRSLPSTGTSLHRLDLHDNPLTAEVAAPLARAVAAHPQLRVLNLNDTSLTDEGVAVLAQALTTGAPDLQVRDAQRHRRDIVSTMCM